MERSRSLTVRCASNRPLIGTMDIGVALSHPRLLRRGISSRDPAERQALTDIAGALIQIAVDRAEFTRTVEPRNRRTVRPHDLRLLIAPRAALRVEHRWRQFHGVERPVGNRR